MSKYELRLLKQLSEPQGPLRESQQEIMDRIYFDAEDDDDAARKAPLIEISSWGDSDSAGVWDKDGYCLWHTRRP